MFVCLDCGYVFEEAVRHTETHGFTDGRYETWHGCPKCSGAFVETRCCDNCGEYIVDKLTIPLTYNGMMSITARKAVSNIT